MVHLPPAPVTGVTFRKTIRCVLAALLAVPLVVHAQRGGGISPGLVKQADPIKAEEVPLRKPPAPIPPRGCGSSHDQRC